MTIKTKIPLDKSPPVILERLPIPGKRSQEYGRLSGNKFVRICYGLSNPHYSLDAAKKPHPINPEFWEDVITPAGKAARVYSQNVVSMGRLTGTSKNKYLGLRPDVCQVANTESLEFDLVGVEFDGAPVSMPVSKLKIINSRQRCRQMIPAFLGLSSFRIELRLHLKGLRVEKNPRGEFWFFSLYTGEFRFRIRNPVLTDIAGRPLTQGTGMNEKPLDAGKALFHSLTENADGSFSYIKESCPGFKSLELPGNFWIDADIYYSTASDGYIGRDDYSWDKARNSASGESISDSASSYNRTMICDYWSSRYFVNRAYIQMDTDGVINPASGSVVVRGYDNDDSVIYIQEGTQGSSLALEDFSAFTESAFDSLTWVAGSDNEFELNSAGIAAINTGGLTCYCLRETQDYNNSTPTTDTNKNGMYFYESAYDPYLSIVEGTPPGGMFFCKGF